MKFKHFEFVDILRIKANTVEDCLLYCERKAEKSFREVEWKQAHDQLKKLQFRFNRLWKTKGIGNNYAKFTSKYHTFMEQSMEIAISHDGSEISTEPLPIVTANGGRPSLKFQDCSERSKRRRVEDVLNACENNCEMFLSAAKRVASSEKDSAMSKLLTVIIKDQNAASILKLLNNKSRQMTDEEGLAYYLNANLTVNQYKLTRSSAITFGHIIYPIYTKVLAAKQSCYPPGIVVTETSAMVEWKDLIQHTLKRIIESNEEVIEDRCSMLEEGSKLKFIISVGMDGTSSQKLYNQKINDNASESSLFVVAMIPLRLISDDNTIIWTCPSPQSVRFCRAQKMLFQKESKELSKKEYEEIEKKLKEIEPMSVHLPSGF